MPKQQVIQHDVRFRTWSAFDGNMFVDTLCKAGRMWFSYLVPRRHFLGPTTSHLFNTAFHELIKGSIVPNALTVSSIKMNVPLVGVGTPKISASAVPVLVSEFTCAVSQALSVLRTCAATICALVGTE